ncbi:MAG: hypothetical protein H6907_04970 [Hyphomicrobiales bacterium]|nr:hypothetical protein [Hyphomicrobiales bacterium]MCP5371067.1 hypothetical protein [Hyphomicrobiales bacterium]
MTGALSYTAVTLAPLVPWPALWALAAVAAAVLALGLARRARGMVWRTVVMALLLAALANPQATREAGDIRPDIALVLVDDSQSQAVGERPAQTAAAVQGLRQRLARLRNLEVREVRYDAKADGDEAGTRLHRALTDALAEIPSDRFAGAFLVTDGQVADVPAQPAPLTGPVHVLLTGGPGEADRRLIVDRIPGYGIVGKTLEVLFRVEEHPSPLPPAEAGTPIGVRLRVDGELVAETLVDPGQAGRLEFALGHAGASIVELEADVAPGELSAGNNRAAVRVNGVRDRFRVLLVSGQPHAGERVWRNLLKSDPSVDLVHFTILRPPEKDDFTPLRELSLIVFPIEELFVRKLHDFDLIVFDRYIVRDVLPPSYFRNIAEYVRAGGALLASVGPEYAGLRSLYQTPLGDVLPARPTQQVREGGYRPEVTEQGRLHPVTAQLPLMGGVGEAPRWGRWFRYIETGVDAGDVLMRAPDQAPLLVLHRVDEGRVAQLASDHIWLWARGFEGGGPQAELLRRLAHWLVREPDLEEERLTAKVEDGQLRVERRSLQPRALPATVTAPSGATFTLTLEPGADGIARAAAPAAERGLYRIEAGGARAFTAAGALNPVELADLRASAETLAPLAAATGGGVTWLRDGLPDVRQVRPGRDRAGRGWAGMVRHESRLVTSLTLVPLLPGLLLMALALGLLMLTWWREGR